MTTDVSEAVKKAARALAWHWAWRNWHRDGDTIPDVPSERHAWRLFDRAADENWERWLGEAKAVIAALEGRYDPATYRAKQQAERADRDYASAYLSATKPPPPQDTFSKESGSDE